MIKDIGKIKIVFISHYHYNSEIYCNYSDRYDPIITDMEDGDFSSTLPNELCDFYFFNIN